MLSEIPVTLLIKPKFVLFFTSHAWPALLKYARYSLNILLFSTFLVTVTLLWHSFLPCVLSLHLLKKIFKLPVTLFHLHLFVSPAALLPSPTMTEEIAGLNLGQTIKLHSYWIGFYFPNLLIFYIKYFYLHYDDLPLSPAASLLFHALILEWQDTNTIIILVTPFVFRSTPSLCYHNSLIIRPFIKWRSSLLTIFNKVE